MSGEVTTLLERFAAAWAAAAVTPREYRVSPDVFAEYVRLLRVATRDETPVELGVTTASYNGVPVLADEAMAPDTISVRQLPGADRPMPAAARGCLEPPPHMRWDDPIDLALVDEILSAAAEYRALPVPAPLLARLLKIARASLASAGMGGGSFLQAQRAVDEALAGVTDTGKPGR